MFFGHGKYDACLRDANCGSNNRRTYYKGKMIETLCGGMGVFQAVACFFFFNFTYCYLKCPFSL